MNNPTVLAAWAVLVLALPAAASDRLVVHEWGTFTSLQDEAGTAVRGINTDDEPVPDFVHRIARPYLFRPTEVPVLSQGARYGNPDVTMRLETPVLYFHPPASQKGELEVDVEVEFRGGWLTEYYPKPHATVDGSPKLDLDDTPLTEKSVGRLLWKGLKVGGGGKGRETKEHVWTAPRAVKAANVSIGGESERFLFYRGVAHLDAPVRVARDAGGGKLKISVRDDGGWTFPGGWLADVRPDGTCAYRRLPAAREPVVETPAEFASDQYDKRYLAKLRAEMHQALVKDGLFADEAEALLSTWELSYFKSPGQRLFFLVPRQWTDRVLPLKLSVPADVARVMVGRIEIITPRQRELVRKIAAVNPKEMPNLTPVLQAMQKLASDPARKEQYAALASGRGDLADLGVEVPETYRHFLELGRFRMALLWNRPAGEAPSRTLIQLWMSIQIGRTYRE